MHVQSRIALFIGDKQITEYKYTNFKVIHGFHLAYNHTEFDIYNWNEKHIMHQDLSIRRFHGNYFVVSDGEYQGVFSYAGIPILPIEFDYIHFEKDCIIVEKNNLCGVYLYNGKLLIPIEYDNITFKNSKSKMSSSVIIATKNNSYSLYTIDGNLFWNPKIISRKKK